MEPESKHQPTDTDPEPTVPTPIVNKIIDETTPHIRNKILSSTSLLASFRIEMRTASQDQVDSINTHIDLFPDPGEFEDLVIEHKTKMKSKENTNIINNHIIRPIKTS